MTITELEKLVDEVDTSKMTPSQAQAVADAGRRLMAKGIQRRAVLASSKDAVEAAAAGRPWESAFRQTAAGHLSDRGYWHPGRAEGCVKCPTPEPPNARKPIDTSR